MLSTLKMPKFSKRLILILFSFILMVAFFGYSYLVAKEMFIQHDFDTTVKFQDRLPSKVDLPFSILSILGSAEITILIWLSIFIVILVKKYWLTLIFFPLFFVSIAVEIIGKVSILHPGPPHLFYRGVLDFSLPSHYVATLYSYPSGHVTRTSFLITFLIVWLLIRVPFKKGLIFKLTLLGLLLAMLVSRIYLGEHWTTDVIGGLLLGSSFGIFAGAMIPKTKEAIKT